MAEMLSCTFQDPITVVWPYAKDSLAQISPTSIPIASASYNAHIRPIFNMPLEVCHVMCRDVVGYAFGV